MSTYLRRDINAPLSDLIKLCERYIQAEGKEFGTANPKKSERKCYLCGKTGHVKADCKQASDSKQASIKCHKCGTFGHKAADCTKTSNKSYTCFLCNKVGHRAHECPKRQVAAAAVQAQTEPERTSESSGADSSRSADRSSEPATRTQSGNAAMISGACQKITTTSNNRICRKSKS